jgi:hypothetical protein
MLPVEAAETVWKETVKIFKMSQKPKSNIKVKVKLSLYFN